MPLKEAVIRDRQILIPMASNEPADLTAALDAVVRPALPFRDALLWATARRAGVTVLCQDAEKRVPWVFSHGLSGAAPSRPHKHRVFQTS